MTQSKDEASDSQTRAARTGLRNSPTFKARSGLTIADLAQRKALATPERVALRDEDGAPATFEQIFAEALAVAGGLQKLGIQAGDTISFQLPNWREAVAINLAAALLGVRVNPITPIYRGAELRIILADARSKVLFIPEIYRSINYQLMIDDLRAGLPELRHVLSVRGKRESERSYEWLCAAGARSYSKAAKVDPGAAKLLLFTSGTTGRAKGVIHTHESMEFATLSAVKYWSLATEDLMLMASPVTHITGYAFGLELPFLCDATVLLMERWDASKAVQIVDRFCVTASIGATPFLKELIDEAEHQRSRMASLRLFACGGAAVPPELILRAARVTDRCCAFRVYGATEIPLVTKGFIEQSQRNLAAETDGRVVDYEIKIADSQGAILPRGRIGEVRARGPAMLVSYTDPGEMDKCTDEDGYFRTGDLGKLTEDDAIVITGRLKDIIIRGGENLSPVEIENALERHPAIQEAAVVAMPHPRLGEGVAAFVRAHEGVEVPSLTEIADFLNEIGLARQKFPERVEYVDDFPRTASGKVRKDQLRDALRRPLVISSDRERQVDGGQSE